MHPTCSLLSLHFSCTPNLLFPRYAAPPFPFQKRAGMSDINHSIDWGLIQLIWLTRWVFPACLTAVSPTALMGRCHVTQEPRNSTKSHHTTNLTQKIYWENKRVAASAWQETEKNWTGNRVYIVFLVEGGAFQGEAFGGWDGWSFMSPSIVKRSPCGESWKMHLPMGIAINTSEAE